MCRLLAWRSAEPITPAAVLGPDRDRLAQLSRVHCDGWGIASAASNDSLLIERGADPAHLCPDFTLAMASHASRSGIVHLRWATEELAVNLGNTHPFTADTTGSEIAFEHNGMLPDSHLLLADIDPDIVAGFRGDTDSERYFGLLLTEMRRDAGDVTNAIQRVAKRLSDVAYTSLNAMLLTPQTLAVVCLFKPENLPWDEEEDYFNLTWGVEDGIVSAWSTGVRPSATDARPLDNGMLLLVDIASGDIDLVSIN
jgi:predicted glutamine amidotransferase